MNETGNIIIEEVVSEFTKIHNKLIENKNINPLTLGVYVKIMRLGKSWKLNIKGLATTLGLSDTKVRECIKSLEIEGFLVRTSIRKKDGTLAGYDYVFKSVPAGDDEKSKVYATNQTTQNPESGKTVLWENQTTENQESLYKDLNVNKELNINKELKKQKDEKENAWRHDYEVYRSLVTSGVDRLLSDSVYQGKYESWFRNIDYHKTIEKTADWWLSEQGWEFCKRRRKTNKLNFYTTIKNNLDKNRVYKSFETQKAEAVIAKTDEKLDMWRQMKGKL